MTLPTYMTPEQREDLDAHLTEVIDSPQERATTVTAVDFALWVASMVREAARPESKQAVAAAVEHWRRLAALSAELSAALAIQPRPDRLDDQTCDRLARDLETVQLLAYASAAETGLLWPQPKARPVLWWRVHLVGMVLGAYPGDFSLEYGRAHFVSTIEMLLTWLDAPVENVATVVADALKRNPVTPGERVAASRVLFSLFGASRKVPKPS